MFFLLKVSPMNLFLRLVAVAILPMMCLSVPAAALELPAVFSDHAVLQRDLPVTVWGWAQPGEAVTIEFAGQQRDAKANDAGRFEVQLDPLSANAEPAEMVVRGESQSLTVKDLLVGEVWLCGGQSNMAWTVQRSVAADKVIQAAHHPNIRQIKAPNRVSEVPLDRVEAAWEVASPETVGGWTAVGYFFALRLQDELDVPVGLLNINWGGTRIEPWTPVDGFKQVDATRHIYDDLQRREPTSDVYAEFAGDYLQEVEQWLSSARDAVGKDERFGPAPQYPEVMAPHTSHQNPANLYRGMLHAFVPFAIRGSIWYQGESNHGEGMTYVDKTRALLAGWRDAWRNPELPYYFVQIAPFQYGNEPGHVLAEFWEAQAAIEDQIPHTGMVVINDVATLDDIHPPNKAPVGERLADLALRDTYGRDDLLARGPRIREMKFDGEAMQLTFDHVGQGLSTRDSQPPTHFELAGRDQPWTQATARIVDSQTIELTAPGIDQPVAMRFAWDKLATPNLVNSAGLPAGAFRLGTPPDLGTLKMNVPEAAEFTVVYELDLNKMGETIQYEVNHADQIGAFDRIAYFVELGDSPQETQFVYVSMDAFTDDAKLIGIPTAQLNTTFQQPVANLSVVTNVPRLPNGQNQKGNLEFWPFNYGKANAAKVPGASNNTHDHGDKPNADGAYGSMQIHLTDAGQTLFALNGWTRGNDADLGLGNQPDGEPDWTFARNAHKYPFKKLTVLVRPR